MDERLGEEGEVAPVGPRGKIYPKPVAGTVDQKVEGQESKRGDEKRGGV